MKFECAYDKLLPIDQLLLIQNPKNNNKHSKEQIDRLAKLIDFQGQRKAITISNRSGFICTGHGTLMAMHKLGWKEAAVDYQDFISEAQEYAHMTADNAIALWAEFNEAKFIEDVATMDIGDIELFGLKEIPELIESEVKNTGAEIDLDSFDNFQHKCPKCGFEWDGETSNQGPDESA